MDLFYSQTSTMQQLRVLFGRPLSTPERNHHFQVDKTIIAVASDGRSQLRRPSIITVYSISGNREL